LEGDSDTFRTALVEENLMRSHTKCGWFDCVDLFCPIVEDVCREHFMNMDVYDRATFIYRPEFSESWEELIAPISSYV
jgi:hypothetical protein